MAATAQTETEALLESIKVQLNTRVSAAVKADLDRYLDRYMTLPLEQRPAETEDWPATVTGVVEEALRDWLAAHPQKRRPGTRKKS